MLYFISLLFLTNFHLGEWVRRICGPARGVQPGATPEEEALDQRARDLQKQVRKLQEEVRALRPGRGHETRARAHRPRPERAATQQRRAGPRSRPSPSR